jgi:DNA topoisomerase VI subunit B
LSAVETRALARTTFTTSRLLEFCSEKELRIQTGAAVEHWPLVALKELVDNALDAVEEAGTAPRITVTVGKGKIVVADNGPGIPTKIVRALLDFSVRVSSREAYVSPTRGAQGNALKTILAMPYVLDGEAGRVEIEAHEVKHAITFRADAVKQEPRIDHVMTAASVKTGTRMTVHWPERACLQLADAEARFLQMAEDYTWLNPHLDLTLAWNGKRRRYPASAPTWEKWRPNQPTCPHWYDQPRLERLIGAHVSHGSNLTVREFISEFRGLSGTAKQAAVLGKIALSRAPLASLCSDGGFERGKIAALLAAMQAATKPVKAAHLGLIGKEHLVRKMTAAGAEPDSINYSRTFDTADGDVPCVVEFAFGWCPKADGRRLITGINWSPAIENPFRQLGGYGQSLDTVLSQQRLDREEPVIVVLHVASPRVEYLDRGKGAIAISGDDDDES